MTTVVPPGASGATRPGGDGSPGPLRVLWLIKGLGPGGAERLLVAQAAARDRDRFRVAVAYLLPFKDHLVPELEALGVPTICLDGGHESDLRWAARLRRLLVEHPADVVHVHSPYVAAVTRLVLRTLPPATRPALLTTEHNRWPRHDRVTRTANRVTLGLDDATLAVSDDVRSTMPPGAHDDIEVVVHGIDLDAVRAAAGDRATARTALGLADDDLAVVTVANLRREKALEVLLEAAALVARDGGGDRIRFLVVGQGPLADELDALHRRLGLGDRLRLLGYRDDVPAVVGAADVFCLSSRHEGLPVALMEALALGVPVVATAVGGVPELITTGVDGVLVPADDPRALADAVVDLATDDARRAALAAGAAERGEAVGIGPAQRRLEERYLELAAARRTAAGSRSNRS